MSPSSVTSPGCVVFLLDESSAMAATFPKGTKPMAESVATALNSLLNQLATGPEFSVAVVGYRSDSDGQAQVGCRWAGPLAHRELVSTRELANNPLRVEDRVRRIPGKGEGGMDLEETVRFPVWYAPAIGGKAPQIAAFDYCQGLLSSWLGQAGPSPGVPLVVHVSAGGSGDGNPAKAVGNLQKLAVPAGGVLVFHAQLGSSDAVPATLYPSNRAYLPLGASRDLFERSSPLPAPLLAALRQSKAAVNNGARGMVFQAKLADLIRLLALVKDHVKSWPAPTPAVAAPAPEARPAAAPVSTSPTVAMPAAPVAPLPEVAPAPLPVAEAALQSEVTLLEGALTLPDNLIVPGDLGSGPPPERLGLVVFVLDRSVADPFSGNLQNSCTRLQEHANQLLAQLAKEGHGSVEVALLSYGLDSTGQVEVRYTFEGPLAGRTIVKDTELADGALRVDQVEEEVPNGIGGLIKVNRKKSIYVELEPTLPASPLPAFETVQQVLADWTGEHPGSFVPPVIVHLTRGRLEPAEMRDAAAGLRQATSTHAPLLYHLVVTEAPHRSLAYPDGDGEVQEDFRPLWELSSPLLGRQQLAATKSFLKEDSRGFVINGKLDLLCAGILEALARGA